MLSRFKSLFRLIGLGFKSLTDNGIKETFKSVVFFLRYRNSISADDLPVTENEPCSFIKFIEDIKYCGGEIFLPDTLKSFESNNKPTVAIVSHELNLTGAPWAVYYMAMELKKQGNNILFLSPRDGNLRDELGKNDIPVVILPTVYDLPVIDRSIDLFRFIVLSTNVAGPLARRLSCMNISVLWWIHEADFNYHTDALDKLPERIGSNIHVYCGGEYARAVLNKYRPLYKAESLLYLTPDFVNDVPQDCDFVLPDSEGRTVYAVVGTMEERKNQDLIVDAINKLTPDELASMVFVFVGVFHSKTIEAAVNSAVRNYPQSVRYYKRLNHNEIVQLYKQSDCLICSSKDDPMPIVVTEAMILSRSIICASNTGSAPILEERNAGLVFPSGDVDKLLDAIRYIRDNKNSDELKTMAKNARQTYEDLFSEDAFISNISKVCSELIITDTPVVSYEGVVSVAIPSYNAGDDFKTLIPLLKSQKNIGKVEIIVVDSGSEDGSADYAESEGCKVIRIPQSEFSHSYARNLAASNATGDYILFMTQDAIPDGEKWIAGLLKPVLINDAVAVSCFEKPKNGSDLLARVSNWANADYLGILHQDRIMEMPKKSNFNSIRRNGQLNDVTCLVKKDIFDQFKYRGDYAEDLDLGVRLIKAGYKTALLSGVKVIHSHTRPCFYHFKRAYVDSYTLKKILPDMPVQPVTAQQAANMAITAWCVTSIMMDKLPDLKENTDDFFAKTGSMADEVMNSVKKMQLSEIKSIIYKSSGDENMRKVILELFDAYSSKYSYNDAIVRNQQAYVTNLVPRYMDYAGESFESKTIGEVRELYLKLMGLNTGIMFANYRNTHDEESVLTDLINKYSKGV